MGDFPCVDVCGTQHAKRTLVSMTTPSVSEPVAVGTLTSTDRTAMAMVTTLFFMWGLLTSLNDILVPHLKSIFDLNYAEVILIQFCFFSASFFLALPSAHV